MATNAKNICSKKNRKEVYMEKIVLKEKKQHLFHIGLCPKCGAQMTREIRIISGTSVWAGVCTNKRCQHTKRAENLNFDWLS